VSDGERRVSEGFEIVSQTFPGGVGPVEMDELVFCLPEKKWMSIYGHWGHLAACGYLGSLVPAPAEVSLYS